MKEITTFSKNIDRAIRDIEKHNTASCIAIHRALPNTGYSDVYEYFMKLDSNDERGYWLGEDINRDLWAHKIKRGRYDEHLIRRCMLVELFKEFILSEELEK